jgi:hypothetical protein
MNTSEKVEISYVWDRENLEKSFEKAYTHYYKNSARRYIGWLFIAMAQFGVVAALKNGSVALLLFSTLLIFYWYVVKKWLLKRRTIQTFKNSPLRDKKIALTVTEEGIMQDGMLISWEEVDGIESLDGDIVIYSGGKNFYIPRSGFRSVEDLNRFKKMAEEKGKLYV